MTSVPENQDKMFRFLSEILNEEPPTIKLWNRRVLDLDSNTESSLVLSALNQLWVGLSVVPQHLCTLSDSTLHPLWVLRSLFVHLKYHGMTKELIFLPIFELFFAFSFEIEKGGMDTAAWDKTGRVMQTLLPENIEEGQDETMMLCHPIQSITAVRNFIKAKRLLGLPGMVRKHLWEHFDRVILAGYEDTVIDLLENLFQQFLYQDPTELEQDYPATRFHQEETLWVLTYYAGQYALGPTGTNTKYAELLEKWANLVEQEISKSLGSVQNCSDQEDSRGRFDTFHLNESSDLRDVAWLLDGMSPANDDPHDLQDVLWMFDLDDGLDLSYIRQCVNDALGRPILKGERRDWRRGAYSLTLPAMQAEISPQGSDGNSESLVPPDISVEDGQSHEFANGNNQATTTDVYRMA